MWKNSSGEEFNLNVALLQSDVRNTQLGWADMAHNQLADVRANSKAAFND